MEKFSKQMSNGIVSKQANTNIIRILVFVNKCYQLKLKYCYFSRIESDFNKTLFNTIWHNVWYSKIHTED